MLRSSSSASGIPLILLSTSWPLYLLLSIAPYRGFRPTIGPSRRTRLVPVVSTVSGVSVRFSMHLVCSARSRAYSAGLRSWSKKGGGGFKVNQRAKRECPMVRNVRSFEVRARGHDGGATVGGPWKSRSVRIFP